MMTDKTNGIRVFSLPKLASEGKLVIETICAGETSTIILSTESASTFAKQIEEVAARVNVGALLKVPAPV